MPRTNRDPDADHLTQMALAAVAAFYDTLQGDLGATLAGLWKRGADAGEIILAAQDTLAGYLEPLASVLADAELGAGVNGAAEVTAGLRDEAPADPEPEPWEWPGMEPWLPLVEEAAKDLHSRQLVTRPEFDLL